MVRFGQVFINKDPYEYDHLFDHAIQWECNNKMLVSAIKQYLLLKRSSDDDKQQIEEKVYRIV